ncbi:DegT/DnrJ/EryC1/StrS family aminotransferase [Novispirillum itersonii]|uniref:DegT/DnrJ/EryC1/StrS family aminotransferase n=1 Tax=Novispirillum itersonii TaxID=189 RepID=UPI001FDFD6C2
MSVLRGYRVPQSRADIGEKDIDAVVRTLRSGWLTSGPSVLEFERAFSDYMGGGRAGGQCCLRHCRADHCHEGVGRRSGG